MKKDTLVVKFTGGLGNQLFQYAFYKWLEKQYPEKKILADLSEYILYRPHQASVAWEIFENMSIKKANFFQIMKASGQMPIFYGGKGGSRINDYRVKLNDKVLRNKGYFLDINHNGPEDSLNRISEGTKYLEGFWQNTFYYDCIKNIEGKLRFNINEPVAYEDEITNHSAVAVHVRRGDYVGSEFEKGCSLKYYSDAIDYMKSQVEEPFFYFFSDDPEYVEKSFDWLNEKKIIHNNNGIKSYYDMYLMSLCPNCILANSTFSIWAAYLNNNVAQTVTYPDVDFVRKMVRKEWVPINI